MGKKGKKAKKPPAAASAVSPTASADAPADIEAEADPVVPAPAEDSSNDSGDDASGTTEGDEPREAEDSSNDSGDDASGTTEGDEPREEAPIQPRPPAVEDAEALTERSVSASGASEHLAMELASLRSRCVSLEEEADAASSAHAEALRSLRAEKDALARSHLAELARARAVADADASSAKTELASMRAMSSAQRAKIDALGETVSALETTLERFERERDATDATRAAATAEAVALALAAADARHADALRAAVHSGREALRRAYVVHAAAKQTWAAEKIGLIEARGDAFEREAEEAARVARLARAAVGTGTPRGPDDDRSRSVRLFKSLTEDDEKEALLSPGAALRALFAATTPSRSRAALDAARADAERESTFESNTEPNRDRRSEISGRSSTIRGAKKTSGSSSGSSGTSESESESESESSPKKSSSADGSDGRDGSTSPATGIAIKNDVGGELADLLDDAMEDEISASVARGYCVDAETGALVVGAGAIVEKVMVKYRGDSEAPRRNLSPLFSPRNAGDVGAILPEAAVASVVAGQGPAFQSAVREANSVRSETPETSETRMRPSEAFALRVERERHRRERATLLAELQQSRAETQMARLEARSEHSIAEAVETMSLEYEKEEDVSVRRLELAAEVRARALEAALQSAREKAAPKAALRAVLAELGELKARLARVRDAQETSARLIAPTVASALACLKL